MPTSCGLIYESCGFSDINSEVIFHAGFARHESFSSFKGARH